MKMKKNLLIVIFLVTLVLSGCMTQAEKDLAVADGRSNPFIDVNGRDGGKYIVINASGGVVYDVWKIENSVVSTISGSDGWEFVDYKGNLVRVGGDCLVIRCNDNETFNMYEEYHWTNIVD